MTKSKQSLDPVACREMIDAAVDSHVNLVRAAVSQYADQIVELAERLMEVFDAGGKLVLFGNGGSAADAQHIASEFVGRLRGERKALPALALTNDTSVITSLGNDYGFEGVFVRQVVALVSPGDAVIAISTSGRSRNVIEAVRAARKKGAFVIALTGGDGGQLAPEADVALIAPGTDTQRVQEAHILLGHLICEIIDTTMRGTEQKGA